MEIVSGPGFDGIAVEKYPYQNDETSEDKNTPFIVEMGEKLVLTELELADIGGNTFDGSADYIISANPQFPFSSSHFIVTQENGYKLLSATSGPESVYAVSDTVGVRYLTLPWKVQTAGGSTIVSGSCDIKVYVPLDTPDESECPFVSLNEISSCAMHHDGLFEDILAISCSAAEGASTQAGVFDLIWKKIQTCHIELMDGRVLQYWGHGRETVNEHDSTASLLREADGTCGDWSSFFVDLLKSQGIDADYSDYIHFAASQNPSLGLFYDNERKTILSNTNDRQTVCYLRQTADHYQGNCDPDSVDFIEHVINVYNGNLYDATCGAGPYEASNAGLLQYYRGNCGIEINGHVYKGDELEFNDFVLLPY